MRPRLRARREEREQRDGDEVPERRRGPVDEGCPVEPGRVDQEDDRCDQDLAEPADDEEERREDDGPEPEVVEPDGFPEIKHVPTKPEDDRPEQDDDREGDESDHEPAGSERRDPEDS